ncbi:MAG: MarR family winged helix-turn-helix transcriptional regulator [Sphingomicrobium sp.]
METSLIEIGETAHALRRAFDRRASALGVTRAQWRVLVKLSRQSGLRQVELADMLDVEPITLCRIIDRLEDAGLVERRRDPADRRAWRLELTAKAEPLVGKLRAIANQLVGQAFAGLDDDEVTRLRAMLGKIRENVAVRDPAKRASVA